MPQDTKMTLIQLVQVFKGHIHANNIVCCFFIAVSLGSRAPKLPDEFRLDSKIDFQRTFFTKCTTILIDGTGPPIIEKFVISLIHMRL